MYRFVAFNWDRDDLMKADEARRLGHFLLSASPDLRCVLDTPGLCVFHAPEPGGACHAYLLKQNAGVIVGRLFAGEPDKDRVPSDPAFSDKESDLVIESQGRRLVERYWGNYVAFLRETDSKRNFIVRDPTGGLPCFLTNARGIDVILSDMEDCVRLNLTLLSPDWEHLTAFFVHCRLVTRTTGFKEVTQLYAGECVAIEDGRKTYSFYWNPARVCETDAIEAPDEARAAVRTVIRHCVNAWASCYDSIVHELSGGLDSSIVAACLAKGKIRAEVLCFHFFTKMTEGDERPYARAAAQSASRELIEAEGSASGITLESVLNPSKIATPAVLGFLPAPELLKQRLARERNAGAIFSGEGGDHLFQQAKIEHIAAEYAHRHGLRLKLFRIVADTSRLTKQSIWSVSSASLRYGLLRRAFDPYKVFLEAPCILTDDALASVSPHAYSHPWIEDASHLPASKIVQVFNVVDCQMFYQRPCPIAEQIHPLISLPIIERSLQIPTYILAHRGRPRGLIREAFEADLPATIINRYSKGGTTSYFNRMLVENATFLRELLLEGTFVRQGVLDRRELEKQLSERELVRGTELFSMLNAARAELWLRTWSDARQQTTA